VITSDQETAIRDVLATMPTLAVGIGTAEQACSVAAINLALTGRLTDIVPDCMSHVIGRWIIGVQDRMLATIRDSADWRELLVLAAGTGRAHETERLSLVMSWMWDALALLQPQADANGYGTAWATMLRERTPDAADEAAAAAEAAYVAAAAAATAYEAAYAYAAAAADAAEAAYVAAAADAAADAAVAASEAAYAYAAADATAWATIDPVGLLRRLVAVTDARALGDAV
jgi:hypothetical protein